MRKIPGKGYENNVQDKYKIKILIQISWHCNAYILSGIWANLQYSSTRNSQSQRYPVYHNILFWQPNNLLQIHNSERLIGRHRTYYLTNSPCERVLSIFPMSWFPMQIEELFILFCICFLISFSRGLIPVVNLSILNPLQVSIQYSVMPVFSLPFFQKRTPNTSGLWNFLKK